MFDWISQSRTYFLHNYTEVGDNYQSSYDLQKQHGQFSINAMVRRSEIASNCLKMASMFTLITMLVHSGSVHCFVYSSVAKRQFYG